MKIIRDSVGPGLNMIALLIEWGLTRCNQQGCHNFPTTIIAQTEAGRPFALCEKHFQMCNVPDGGRLQLEFGPLEETHDGENLSSD